MPLLTCTTGLWYTLHRGTMAVVTSHLWEGTCSLGRGRRCLHRRFHLDQVHRLLRWRIGYLWVPSVTLHHRGGAQMRRGRCPDRADLLDLYVEAAFCSIDDADDTVAGGLELFKVTVIWSCLVYKYAMTASRPQGTFWTSTHNVNCMSRWQWR